MLVLLIATVAVGYAFNSEQNLSSALQRGNYSQAAELLSKQVQAGDIRSLTMLGNLYYLGLGVARDYPRSAKLYSRAAFAGDLAARVNMGHVYNNGNGTETDSDLAYAWYNLARTGGSVVAQGYMSEMLADHKITYHYVRKLRTQYATINNFPKLH